MLRALVVDDDEGGREYAAIVLRDAGYDVLGFGDPVEAIEWLSAGNTCDVLVTDVVLPGMDGIALSRLVQKVRPRVGIVACTGHPDRLEEAIALGWLPLMKPFTPEQLVAVIADAISSRSRVD